MAEGWRGVFRRHERALAVGWLALVAALAVVVVLPPTRVAALEAMQRGVRWWDDRWERRVEHGAALLAEGRAEEAATYLARLEGLHPASNVRHARDKETARLLRLLGRAYEATGRRGRAMATYQRLVAFDSLSWHNWFVLGEAAERLESGWAVAPEARDAFAGALRILPSHLPSLRGYVAFYLDRGEFGPIRDALQRYADAHLVQHVAIRVGDTTLSVPVLADGRPREYEIALAGARSVRGIEVQAGGLPFVVGAARLAPAEVVGVAGRAAPVALALAARPDGAAGLIAPQAAAAPGDVRAASLTVYLTLFKPVDAKFWAGVSKSFSNLLDDDGLRILATRLAVFPTPEAADAVLGRQAWALEGLGLGPDEQPY